MSSLVQKTHLVSVSGTLPVPCPTLFPVFAKIPAVVPNIAAIGPHVFAVGVNIASVMPNVATVPRNVSAVVIHVSTLCPRRSGIPRSQVVSILSAILRQVSPIARYVTPVMANVAVVFADVITIVANIATIVANVMAILRRIRRSRYWNLCSHHRAQSQRSRRDPEQHLAGAFHIVSHLQIRSSGVANMNPTLPEKVSPHYRGTSLLRYVPAR
jgi:hypothetical protein